MSSLTDQSIPEQPSIPINLSTDSVGVVTASGIDDLIAEQAACAKSDCELRAQYYADTAGFRAVKEALLFAMGTYGVIKQWESLDEQIKLNERGVDQAQEYLELAQKNYEEITVRAFDCNKKLFDDYYEDCGPCEATFKERAFEKYGFEPDHETSLSRAVSSARQAFTSSTKSQKRATSRFAVGMREELNHRRDVRQALAESHAVNIAYRFEDERHLTWDSYYWKRNQAGAAFCENMRAHVISGVNQGTANATGGIQGVGGGVGAINNAIANASGALTNMATFYGGLASDAFGFLGAQIENQNGVSFAGGMLTNGFRGTGGNSFGPSVSPQIMGGEF